MKTLTSKHSSTTDSTADWREVVRQKVDNLRFGSIQITVHDGRVTQVESIEKTRFVPLRKEDTATPSVS